MAAKKYDVIIVGAGPAGIFSALELSEKTQLNILILDKGPDINHRRCPANRGLSCINCEPCLLLSGWGGAGAFSDGKLTLSTKVGGWLDEYMSEDELWSLIDYVDSIYLKFGAPKHVYGADQDKIEEIERRASFAGLKLVQQKLRHMGTGKCAEVLKKMRQFLNGKVDIRMRKDCLLYTSPSPRDLSTSRMPSSA